MGLIMMDEDILDVEFTTDDADDNLKAPEVNKHQRAYSSARRALTEQELMTPAAVNLLLDNIDKLEIEVGEFKPYKSMYHKSDKQVAVLIEKILLSLGSIILGAYDKLFGIGLVGKVVFFVGLTAILSVIIAQATEGSKRK